MEDGNLTPMESKILAAIDDGTLTKEKLEKGVCTLIKMELEQNEHPANMELVSACESLLEKIHQTSYTSNAQEGRYSTRWTYCCCTHTVLYYRDHVRFAEKTAGFERAIYCG